MVQCQASNAHIVERINRAERVESFLKDSQHLFQTPWYKNSLFNITKNKDRYDTYNLTPPHKYLKKVE